MDVLLLKKLLAIKISIEYVAKSCMQYSISIRISSIYTEHKITYE